MLGTIILDPIFSNLLNNDWADFKLNPELTQGIKNQIEINKNQNLFHISKLTNKNTDLNYRNDSICWLNELQPTNEEKSMLIFLNSLKDELKKYFRISLTHLECHYAIYPKGHFYKKHSDQKESDNSRQFSFVLYLNSGWSEQDGGNLRGYKNNRPLFEIKPELGQMILFKSHLIHEVLPSYRERQSLCGWFRTGPLNL